MDEGLVSANVQKRLADENSELDLDDATKIIGCYKALTKQDLRQDLSFDPQPMKRALAFCKRIAASKLIRDEFANVVAEFTGDDALIEDDALSSPDRLNIEIEHVDGTFNAKSRNQLLDWLKADAEGNATRILTNARCLSEGVDVPTLDAIMFLHPRKSLIDVVQSVGRVMRRAEGKKMGYVILPVGVPAGVEPEVALRDNERYRVVWQILNALRAHDERFDGTINQASLGQDVSDRIEIVGVTRESEELRSITHEVTDARKTWGFGLCFLHLRNVKGHPWNHNRVYGLLHSPDYRDRYADNLTKELPRIPCVETYADFRAFTDAGWRLGDLHVNYEMMEPYRVTYKQGTPALWNIADPKAFYRVTKMKFTGKSGDIDKTTVIYNANITMTDIPLEAYDYVVNGKPALEWVMERQVVKTDKASGIVNDANYYANETIGSPAYPLELFLRVITVSLETMKIVRALPKLDLPKCPEDPKLRAGPTAPAPQTLARGASQAESSAPQDTHPQRERVSIWLYSLHGARRGNGKPWRYGRPFALSSVSTLCQPNARGPSHRETPTRRLGPL